MAVTDKSRGRRPSAKETKRAGGARKASAAPRKKKAGPRAFRLDPERLARAREILGTPNDTATIDAALDMVVFARELRAGVEALKDFTFQRVDDAR